MEIKENSKKNFTNYCNVVVAGNKLTVQQTSNNIFNIPPIRKISKYEYVDIRTGEIKNLDGNSKNKSQNIKSVRQTVKKIRNLINANFNGLSNDEYFITLTYAENMTDSKRLMKDFEKFIKRLKYDNNNLLYIGVIEPQRRGAWHVHLLLKYVNNITNNYISDKWGFGFTYTMFLNNVDNVGAYLSAYLTNTKEKKGDRLYMYPSNMKIYRYSRNCKQPIKERLYYKDIFKKYKHLKLKYVKSYDMFNGFNKINSVIFKSYDMGCNYD